MYICIAALMQSDIDLYFSNVLIKNNGCRFKIGYRDLSNMTYLSLLTMMFLNCFSRFLRVCFGLGLGSGLGLGIRLVLGIRLGSGLRLGLG